MKLINKKILSSLLCASMLAAFIPALSVSAALPKDTTTAAGWTASFNNDVDGKIELDSENPYEGEYSLKIVNNTPTKANTYMTVVATVNVQQGVTYEAGFAAKSKKSQKINFLFGWEKYRNLLPFGDTYDWTEHQVEYTATTSGSVDFKFLIDGVTEGFWIDNVYFRKKGTTENQIQNSTFELVAASAEEEQEDFGAEIANLEQTYNKIRQGTTFTQSEFEHVRGGFKFMPIYKTSGITIDGKGDEWADVKTLYMPTLSTQYQIYIKDERELDATFAAKFAYDEEYFYLYMEAEDDIYRAMSGTANYWAGDSIQFAVSRMDEGYGTEMGICYIPETGATEVHSTALTGDSLSKISAKSVLDGTKISYEVRMPWELFFNERYSRPDEFMFNVLYNDNDGDGRRYCVELAPGISEGKTNKSFPVLRLLEESKPWYAWIDGNKTVTVNEENAYSLYLVNGNDSDTQFDIELPSGEVKKQAVGAHMGVRLPFNMTFGEEDVHNIQAKVTEGDYTYTAAYEVTAAMAPPTAEEAASYIEAFKSYVKELNSLIGKCKQHGISTDYEQVNCSTIEKFIEYIQRDIENNDLELFHYQRRCIEELYAQAKADLEAYISGDKEPLIAPKYVTSEVEAKNSAIWADAMVDGKRENRPTFFVGYGHFNAAVAEIPNFNNLAVNAIQTEIGPNSVISSKDGPAEWTYNRTGNAKATCSVQSDVVKEGKYALKVTNSEPYKDARALTLVQTVMVEPNTIYKLGGWSKVENCDRFFIYTNGYSDIVHFGKDGGNTHDWQPWEYTFTTGPEQTTRVLRMVSSGVTTAGYLDGMYLVKEGSDENLLLNGDFETVTDEDKYYTITTSGIKGVQQILEKAERNNISVCVLLSPHYFPGFVLDMYPELRYNLSYGFLKYNIMDERAKEIIEAYLRTIIPMIRDYTSLSSICVSNEPQFWTKNAADFYQPLWVQYITEKFGTVEAMNEAYGTSYTSFEECLIPQNEYSSNMFLDYKLFNDENFAAWHKFMCDIIKELAPEIPLHMKVMEYPVETGSSRLMVQDGTKLENFIGILDWNGNDGANRYENLAKGKSPLEEVLWYDFQRSINNAPVLNTEDHIHVNGSKIYTDEINDFAIQSMWEGAIHGRAFSTIWLWERHDGPYNKSPTFRGNISYRPDTLAGIGRATLDMNRLSYELVALQDEKADVALLYSDAAAVHTREFANVMRWAFCGIMYAGKKVKFVTEDQIEKLQDVKALVVPRVINARESTVNAISDFIANGGKVMLIDEKSLTLDEYKNPHNADTVSYIHANSEVASNVNCNNTTLISPTNSELFVLIRNFIEKCGLDYVTAVDAETGEAVDEVLLDVGVYDGKLLVNVCSYGADRKLKIKVGDKVVTESIDLIKNESVGESFDAKIYVSKLLQIDLEHCFIDVYGHWAEDYISGLSEKQLVSGMSESRFEPNGIVTRAEFLTMLTRASEMLPKGYNGGFDDVSSSDWFAGYVAAALDAGIISGSAFRPNDKITREEMCELLVAFYGQETEIIGASDAQFADMDSCVNKNAVNKAFALGFITGYEDGSFMPQNNMTRAEASVVITKFLGDSADAE